MKKATKARYLEGAEWAIVMDVFGPDNLPIQHAIFVTDGLGLQNRPFTVPTTYIPKLPQRLVLNEMVADIETGSGGAGEKLKTMVYGRSDWGTVTRPPAPPGPGFVLFMGPAGRGSMHSSHDELLVHEMTHVWQGYNGPSSAAYVRRSVMAQLNPTRDAYDYEEQTHTEWGQWNPEAQARLVEDWYANGQIRDKDKDYRWYYVSKYIHHGRVR